MELHEKLQELRKQRGITQEELAQSLYVSRTAVSKWESGRGYPSIDSLKAIAAFFQISVDELLSSNELLTIAEKEGEQRKQGFLDLVFGLLDIGAALLFFLPLFGQRINGAAQSVSLFFLTEPPPYVKGAYVAAVLSIVFMGILTLTLQTCKSQFWRLYKGKLSLLFNLLGVLLFVISPQPYAATFLLTILAIKAFLLIKRR